METNCTVETLGKGTYAISNVDPEQTYDLAINVSSSLATIYLVWPPAAGGQPVVSRRVLIQDCVLWMLGGDDP